MKLNFKNKRGFKQIEALLILVVILSLVIVIGLWIFKNEKKANIAVNQNNENIVNDKINIIDWQSYKNEDYKYEIFYPNNYYLCFDDNPKKAYLRYQEDCSFDDAPFVIFQVFLGSSKLQERFDYQYGAIITDEEEDQKKNIKIGDYDSIQAYSKILDAYLVGISDNEDKIVIIQFNYYKDNSPPDYEETVNNIIYSFKFLD